MRILRILFLGIVLVSLNLTLLHAALPDTVTLSGGSVEPGDTIHLTMDYGIHSAAVGGFAISIEGFPTQFDTAAGAWYTLTPLGTTLATSATASLISFDKAAGLLNWTVVGVNFDQLSQFGIIQRTGQLATFHFIVPADMPEGMYSIDSVADGSTMLPWPVTGGLFC